jgi:predicted ArsR family transcriptional regulator
VLSDAPAAAVGAIDDVLHARSRLGIVTVLTSRGHADFITLKSQLGLTDGNLGAHLRVLEEAGYVKVAKGFEGRKPRTTFRMTAAGRRAFANYLQGLESVIRLARGQADDRQSSRL